MKDFSEAVMNTLKNTDTLTVVTKNIRREPRRQDLDNSDAVYFSFVTRRNSRIDSDRVKLSTVHLRCCSKNEINVFEMLQALDRIYNGHGQAGSYLDFSTEKVHCITSRPMQIDDPAWDTEIQMYVGMFPIEVEWSYK